MRIRFQCDDAIAILSRVLDPIRRPGLDVSESRTTSMTGSTASAVDLPGMAAAFEACTGASVHG